MADNFNLIAAPHHDPSRPNVDYVPMVEVTPRYKKLGRVATELHMQSMTDPLTGLANEKAFTARLDLAIERESQHDVAPGTNSNIVLLDIDVDGFKDVNDTLGHPVGDEILRIIASGLRGSDFAARPHGDEFKILVPNIEKDIEDKDLTKEQRIEALTHRTRGLVAKALTDSSHADKLSRLGVGISIGSAIYRHGETVQEFLKRADAAMYQDKKGKGRR